MAKHIQLKIDDPCHEDWHNMSPVEKGRFCGSCQKQVVDFTRMSDSQVAAFFKKPSTGSVCGRFMQDQLDRDIEIPRKRIPWIKYFFQFALPAFLISARASAQGNVKILKGDTTVVCQKPGLIMGAVAFPKPEIINTDPLVKGRVTDVNGSALAGATVVIKGTNIGTTTDENGNFNLKTDKSNSKIILVASSVGYQSQEIELNASTAATEIKMIVLESQMMGEIVIVGFTRARKAPPIPIIGKLFSDSAARYINAYPNPVSSGAVLTVECKKIKEGDYAIKLVNQLGQTVHSLETRLDKGMHNMNIQLPLMKAGNYLITITGKDSRKIYTEKLIIQ